MTTAEAPFPFTSMFQNGPRRQDGMRRSASAGCSKLALSNCTQTGAEWRPTMDKVSKTKQCGSSDLDERH